MSLYCIQDFQKEFDELLKEHYPFLKIVFKQRDNLIYSNKKLIVWKKQHAVFRLEHFNISDTNSIESFIDWIKYELGFCVDVYRKMRNYWLPAKHTLHLSFFQQNKIGLELALSDNILI